MSDTERRAQLIECIRTGADQHVVCLAAAVLRFCRSHRSLLEGSFRDPGRIGARLDLRRRFERLFDDFDDEVLWAEDVDRLIDAVGQATDPSAVTAWCLAHGLDDALGHRFAAYFDSEMSVGGGEAFPVFPARIKDVLGGPLTSLPERVSPPVDSTAHLGLMPEEPPFALEIVPVGPRVLAQLRPESRVAVGMLNARISGRFNESELQWDRYTRDGSAMFFEVRPTDARRQSERTMVILKGALAAQAEILLFPELSVTEPEVRKLKDQMAAILPSRRPLLVAGSFHATIEGRRVNRCVMILPDGSVIEHDKFESFSFRDLDDHGNSGDIERHEDLQQMNPHVRIVTTGTWSLAAMVCKDFMPPRIAQLIAQLRLRTLVVPAMSPKTEVFETNASSVALHGQTIVLIGNAADAARPDAASAIWSAPLAGHGQAVVRRSEWSVAPLLLVRRLADGVWDKWPL